MDSIEKLTSAITLVEEARGVPLSASCVVHRAEMLEILDEAREALPTDFESARKIIETRDAIIEEARVSAEQMIAIAREDVAQMVEQTSIVQIARDEARKILGLDLDRPAVLVQLGTGDSDVNEKMTAALSGLLGWKDLQVILTKQPLDKDGKSLAPEGLDIRVVRHFPLARVLHAFDAGVCATGYNGVHELLPAQVPTVFVSNIRGTDDQEARAQWCHDMGFALRANQADLGDITATVKQLQDADVRARLSKKCAELPDPTGGAEIAKILYELAVREEPIRPSWLRYNQLRIQEHINRGMRHVAYMGLRRLALIYRFINPHIVVQVTRQEAPIWGSQNTAKELHPLIKGEQRFEHLITGASDSYIARRKEIAEAAYGEKIEIINTKKA